jgi:hypothetical protein
MMTWSVGCSLKFLREAGFVVEEGGSPDERSRL